LTHSQINEQLIANYHNTHYQIGTISGLITLRIDHFSQALAEFLLTSHQSTAAIISAYNPHSQSLSSEENQSAHESLRQHLMQHGHPMIGGLNIDPTGQWPQEKSFFVLGVDLETARAIGQHFKQNAIVWIQSDAIPHLVLLR